MRLTSRKSPVRKLLLILAVVFALCSLATVVCAEEEAAPAASASVFTVDMDGEVAEYDLSVGEDAQEYVDNYDKNLQYDADADTHIEAALTTVRTSVSNYATLWSLVPPVLAILLALLTKEVYSSLFIGILCGGVIYSFSATGYSFETTVMHTLYDGFISSVADPDNIGILIFLVMLGAMVAMMNKAGGSNAFGRWTTKHIKTRMGAQVATAILGILIFIDDYFNCLTVGSVMRPVTDKHNVSRAKLSYLIDAMAAPVCIIAPISSWAAAVTGFAKDSGAQNGMSLFLSAIPYNFYALLTIVMVMFLALTNFDYGPMRKHEKNAIAGDLFTTGEETMSNKEGKVNPKGKVIDLVLPVAFLIVACVVSMIYTGGFFSGVSFIDAFSDANASVGLAIGSVAAMIFTVIFYLCRRVLGFRKCMDSLPEGFMAMVPAILILCCAWTLKTMTDSLGAKVLISKAVESSAAGFKSFLPAIIFLIGVGLSFATGTSWGTFGILIPIVLSVFGSTGGNLTIVAISACMAGAVCGDHCSPISDTTIMASAGAQCNHMNHVSTQLPYALTVAGVSFVAYIVAGFVPNWLIALPIAVALMLGTLIVLRLVLGNNDKA